MSLSFENFYTTFGLKLNVRNYELIIVHLID